MTKIKSRGIIKPVNQLKSKNTHYHKPWLPFFFYSLFCQHLNCLAQSPKMPNHQVTQRRKLNVSEFYRPGIAK